MKNIKKLSLALCFAATVMAAPVFAQVESASWYSNGYNSTARTIRTDTENYIDVRYFDQVKFDKIFLNSNLTKVGFNLGVAKRFNNLYVAGFYNGGFWYNLEGHTNNSSSLETKDDKENPNDNYSQNILNRDVLSKSNPNNNHRTIFMVGFPNKMGLKLDTWLSFNASDNPKNYKNNFDREYYHSETINDPHDPHDPENMAHKFIRNEYEGNLVWSCFDLAAGKTNIKPWARVGVDMYDNRDVYSYKTIEKQLQPISPNSNIDKVTTYNKTVYNDGFYPLLNINLGSDFAFNTNEKFNSLVVLNYGLSSKIYADMDISVESTKFVDNLNSKNNWSEDVVISRTGKVDLTNSLNAMYKFEAKPIDKLTLAGRVGLDTSVKYYTPGQTVTTTTKVNDEWGAKKTIITKKFSNGSGKIETIDGKTTSVPSYTSISKDDKEVTTKFDPTFGLGVAYAVKPNFVLNFGYSGTIPYVEIVSHTVNTTTTTKNYNSADPANPVVTSVNKTENSNKNVETTTGSYSSTLSTGFTWNIANCCALDCAAGISRTPSLEKVWNANWKLGFTFKK